MISFYGNPVITRTPYLNQSWQAPLLGFYLCCDRILDSTSYYIVNDSRSEIAERDHVVKFSGVTMTFSTEYQHNNIQIWVFIYCVLTN